jgi:Fe2+ transport system protein FeoA
MKSCLDSEGGSDKLGIRIAMNLVDAPHGQPLVIVDLCGGESVRRRLMALGFHKGDVVELDGRAILRGPLLVRNCRSDTTVAMGRGVAQKVLVEPVHEPS